MKNRLINLWILLLGIAPFFLFGQTSFRFITKSVTESKAERITSGKNYELADSIYQKLVEARGDRRYEPPKFYLSDSEQWVAFLEGDGLSIGLEKKAFDICMSLPEGQRESAIAALLGHELTHFYEKHQWRSGFADTYADLKIGKTLKDIVGVDKVNNETQSDYLGGFLAYSAGFSVFDKLPDFYDKVYKEYNLKDTMKGYADRSDRKALATRSLKKLDDLIEVFEMANLLTALGRYDGARAFYKHILIDYQSKTIYNNLGVLTVLEALGKHFAENERKYRMPLELDLSFGGSSKDGFSERERKRRALLMEAIRYFDNASSMDSDYAPAYLNKACAYFLMGGEENIERAKFYAGVEAKQKANLKKNDNEFKKTVLDVEVLLALIEEQNSETKEAAKKRLEAIKDQSSIADYNLIIMNGGTPKKGRKEDGPEDEEIDGIEHGDIYTFVRNNKRERKEQELFGEIDFRGWENMGQLKNSQIYAFKPPSGAGDDVYIHITKPGYPGKTTFDDYEVGKTTREEITDEYGEPNFSLGLVAGEIMVYEEFLFIMDGNGKISRWANWFEK